MDTETEDPVEAMARLEAALDRIARGAARPGAEGSPGGGEGGVDTAMLRDRLDAVIAHLRAALAGRPD